MAWRCSAKHNEGLIAALEREGLVKTQAVVTALRRIDRALFVPVPQRPHAYEDRPLPIGYGATISAPHMHAIMLEVVYPSIKHNAVNNRMLRILDVGSGSGFMTAALASLCSIIMKSDNSAADSEDGAWQVIGVEHVKELQQSSISSIQQSCPPLWTTQEKIIVIQGDGRNLETTLSHRFHDNCFDVIHVGAAIARVPPTLLALLRKGGCLVVPVGPQSGNQQLIVYTKNSQGLVQRKVECDVSFIPLTSLEEQLQK